MNTINRRDALRYLAGTGLALGGATWSWPTLAQGEEVIPFTDVPTPTGANARIPPNLQSFFTDNAQFYTVQHYGIPTIDPATYALKIDGLVTRPLTVSLADLKKRPRVEQVVGFECAGNNNARANPLAGNARWVGLSLAALLKDAGLKPSAREVVCFGTDSGPEDVTHGGGTFKVEQHFGRGLSLEDATHPEVMLAYEMNGEPLPQNHGGPLRLIVPGWYGVANVKWLQRIYLQDARFAGRFMAREYVTLRDLEGVPDESTVGRIRLKSAIGRVVRTGSMHRIFGFALTDGTALKTVEVKVDDGPWRAATMSKDNTPWSWKIFTYDWAGATSGEHTLTSRAIDVQGNVQTETEDPNKKTRYENHGQFVRKIKIP